MHVANRSKPTKKTFLVNKANLVISGVAFLPHGLMTLIIKLQELSPSKTANHSQSCATVAMIAVVVFVVKLGRHFNYIDLKRQHDR